MNTVKIFGLILLSLTYLEVGCGSSTHHGRFSALTANIGDQSELCSHHVPASACTQCDSSRAASFKKVNDWCSPHDLPESQCFACHPDLSFEPLPKAPDDADLKSVTPHPLNHSLADIAVKNKVTIIDFWAMWCIPCRKTEEDLNLLLTHNTNLAVRKIEIQDWDDPLVGRYLGGTAKLPLLVVFNAQRDEVGRVSGQKPEELAQLLSQAQK